MIISFRKMHGLGNDFVIIDTRMAQVQISTEQLVAMANRRTGVGCDQFALLRTSVQADIFADMYNADGSSLRACGNATRCIAALMMAEMNRSTIKVETIAGILICTKAEDGKITVDMGLPNLEWQQIPLSHAMDTLTLPVTLGPLKDAVAVNMGNPHAVFFVDDVAAIDLPTLGPKLEHDPLFPDRVNVEVAQVINRQHLRMRVWERGTGITMACGTGACAVLVAAVRRGLADRKAVVSLDGGDLEIEWRESDNHVMMTGPWAESFSGVWMKNA